MKASAYLGVQAPARRVERRRLRVAANLVVSTGLITIGVVRNPGLLLGLAVAAAIGLSCEALAPPLGEDRPARRSPRAWATDLTHAIGNRYLVLPMVTAAVAVVGPVLADAVPPAVGEGFDRLPGVAQLTVLLVAGDFANYWSHRALHQVPLLWRLHAVHHSTEQLDWLATSRGHPIDLVFAILTISLPPFVLGRVAIAPWILTFFFLYPFVCHSNTRIHIPYVERVLVTPKFHHWHHAAGEEAWDRNFGAILSIWDRLFGTVIERDEFPSSYGITGSQLDQEDYLGHLTAPFRPSPSPSSS